MTRNAVELVVGADSMIGSALLRALRASGRRAIGTSRRRSMAGSDTLYLDLCAAPERWDGPPVSVAYLCAAVARLDACRRDPAGSAHVNIDGACRLARALAAAGAFVLYLSTNQVFDGTLPYRRPNEAPFPLSEYGRQKAAAERKIIELGDKAAVLRLTKVLGDHVPLFAGWTAALGRGERIRPFADMWMAPLSIDSVTLALARLGGQRRPGIFHLSGDYDISYADAARMAAQMLGADLSLIEPIATRQADPAADVPPRHTTLDMAGLPATLGMTLPGLAATLRPVLAASASVMASAA
jgi:dTDP-4-dehydrorhamnose reductase